jgi:hypothetical protein
MSGLSRWASFSGRQRANRWLAEVTPRSPALVHSAIGQPGLVALAGLEATQLASDAGLLQFPRVPRLWVPNWSSTPVTCDRAGSGSPTLFRASPSKSVLVAASTSSKTRIGHRKGEGVVAFGEAEAGETVDPRTNQIARASSSTAAITRKVTVSATPSS